MKIIKYTKKTNSLYKVTLENNESILLHEDVILKNNLLIKKEIDDIDELVKQSHDYEINNVALKYISKKMRSKKELRDYLKKAEYSDNLINNAVTYLQEQGYLDDLNYAKAYINDRFNLSNDGPNKISNYLESMHIDYQVYNNYLNEIFTKENIYERITKYLNKMAKSNKKSIYLFKNKMLINLVNLGYDREDINYCLSNLNDLSDKENLEKAKEKIYRQLSKKYSGEELEKRVRDKLYRQGFYE